MEQGIGCSSHPDKNAIRLCDGCEMPFCAECLRKNLLGFYYCQRCYPKLFENTSAPEYEIPRDEKGLRRIQKQVDLSIILDSPYESLKIGYPWIVGVCALIAVVIFLFVFWRGAFFGIGTFNLIVMFASIVIGASVGVMISNKITGKVHDSEFSNDKVIKGIMWAFLGSFVVFGIGYGRFKVGGVVLMIPSIMGGAIGGAIGGYSREIKTGIIGGAIGGAIFTTLAWQADTLFVIVGAIAGASLGMISGAIEGGATSLEIMKSRKVKTVTVLLLIVFLVLILLTLK